MRRSRGQSGTVAPYARLRERALCFPGLFIGLLRAFSRIRLRSEGPPPCKTYRKPQTGRGGRQRARPAREGARAWGRALHNMCDPSPTRRAFRVPPRGASVPQTRGGPVFFTSARRPPYQKLEAGTAYFGTSQPNATLSSRHSKTHCVFAPHVFPMLYIGNRFPM